LLPFFFWFFFFDSNIFFFRHIATDWPQWHRLGSMFS
jgi:hypothetical protein